MAEICATFFKGSKELKQLQTPISGNSISVLISALKEAKHCTNDYLTTLVNEQKDTSNNSIRKAEELVCSDDDLGVSPKKQKR